MNFSIEVEWSSHGNELRSPHIIALVFHRLLSVANRPAKRFVVWEKKHAKWRWWNQEMLCGYTNGHVIRSDSKQEQHLNVPTTFTFFHSEWYTYSHESVQTIWKGWRKLSLLSTRDTVAHKLLEKCQQNICLEDHFTSESYIQRLSFPAGYSGFTYFTHLHTVFIRL